MKGIILAAGKGTRLYPMTKPLCKPLLQVYDKPLIYYLVDTMMKAGIKEILIVIPPDEEETFEKLLGDGTQLGISIEYIVQEVPRGIADAFRVGREFIGNDSVCLILGDNVFYHPEFETTLKEVVTGNEGATVFGYYVDDPRPFGVIDFDETGNAISIEEKPANPKSNYIIPGLYFYDNDVVEIAKDLKPSARGELEITDVNVEYLRRGKLHVKPLDKDFVWLDAGTADSLLEASIVIRDLQKSGKYVACLEETAVENGYITREQCIELGEALIKTQYGKYIHDGIAEAMKLEQEQE